jgi:hypothetical protein
MDQSKYIRNFFSIIFCVSTFLAAFLLFQIEPVVGKIVTPLYGGTASVWTICLFFFQFAVLMGYVMTFAITKLPPKIQLYVYLTSLAISLFWSQIPVRQLWLSDNSAPVQNLLLSLAQHMAVPCIILATVSGIMQVWFGLARLGNPYPLYSLSNLGSMLALLTYPAIIEPNTTVAGTLKYWSWLYCILAVAIFSCALIVNLRSGIAQTPHSGDENIEPELDNSIDRKKFFKWLFFSTMGSAALLSYSSYLTSEVSPIPLLWVLPLAIYLLTFILVFAKDKFYKRSFFLNTWMVLAACEPITIQISFLLSLVVNLILIFEICMICHGEIAISKPGVKYLPTFYLAIALGGAIGGLFVGIIAPYIFTFEAERFFIIVILALFTVNEVALKKFQASNKKILLRFALIGVTIAVLIAWIKLTPTNVAYRERNFYGVAKVVKEGDFLVLYHGHTVHGRQYLNPVLAPVSTGLYYLPLEEMMDFMHGLKNHPMSIGVVGLGVGMFTPYGKPQDNIVFYELDPKIEKIARRYFSFISQAKAKVKIMIGDGRFTLSELPPQQYDFMVIDVFNSDSIPCHLLTREALAIYLQHLKKDGILAFHITNNYLDLEPVLGNLAKQDNLFSCYISQGKSSSYIAMTRNAQLMDELTRFIKSKRDKYPEVDTRQTVLNPRLGVWTDDYVSLLSVLKLHP